MNKSISVFSFTLVWYLLMLPLLSITHRISIGFCAISSTVTSEIVKEFHRVVSPLFEKIKDNIEENETLKNLRDSLLPKLMNGEIEILTD